MSAIPVTSAAGIAVRRSLLLVLLGIAALLGAAAPAPAATHDYKHALWHETHFTEMIAAYRAALPGKLRVLAFKLNEVRCELQVQDPAKPKHVDEYDYEHGQVLGPMPVKLYGSGKLEDSLYDWDDVAWETIPGLVKQTIKKVRLDSGGHIGGVTVSRDLPHHPNPEIVITVSGPREDGELRADAKGNVIEARKL
jgi:hypothetical protein